MSREISWISFDDTVPVPVLSKGYLMTEASLRTLFEHSKWARRRRQTNLRGIMDKGFSVYLAGKITKNGWRHELPLTADIGYTDWSQKSQSASEVLPGGTPSGRGLFYAQPARKRLQPS